jgi:hypothetical protein
MIFTTSQILHQETSFQSTFKIISFGLIQAFIAGDSGSGEIIVINSSFI